MVSINKKGLTLIELIIAISIAAILTGVLAFSLKAIFDVYSYSNQEMMLEKALDEVLEEISGAAFEDYGIKDAMELVKVGKRSITFAPLWVDDSHILRSEHERMETLDKAPFTLNRPFKLGTSLPIAEILSYGGKNATWHSVDITFLPPDKILLNRPQELNDKIRFIFQVDADTCPDCLMTIFQQDSKIIRKYKNRQETIPRKGTSGISFSNFYFSYFDNTNTEVEPKDELIPAISAVKVSLEATLVERPEKSNKPAAKKSASIFINLRNTRGAGGGLIIRKGTKLKIPDSGSIRVFSIANVSGISEGGVIELEARPEKGAIWKVRVELGVINKVPVLRKYSVEYPPGRTVYSEIINQTIDIPLNLMSLGSNGRYDYDYDKDGNNVVNLEGNVELVVTEMSASAATLFVRP